MFVEIPEVREDSRSSAGLGSLKSLKSLKTSLVAELKWREVNTMDDCAGKWACFGVARAQVWRGFRMDFGIRIY